VNVERMNNGVPGVLERIINERGLKKKAVAERAGMEPQKLSDILSNRRLLKVSDLVSLAHALDCTPNDLIVGRSTDQRTA
jgi:DNA-binding Xre family transcriptional regulator